MTAPIMAPARARPPPVSSPGARLMRRTADIPTQKAAGPSSIPRGQTSTTAATPSTSASIGRASATGGPTIGGASMTATGWTLARHIALPRPPVAAAATAPTTSKAMNAAGPGRYGPQIQPKTVEANRSAASKTPAATKRAPATVIARTSRGTPHWNDCPRQRQDARQSAVSRWRDYLSKAMSALLADGRLREPHAPGESSISCSS